MTTLLYSHSACLEHDTGPSHPERPARLSAVLEALDGDDFDALERRDAPRAEREQIERVHPPRFVEKVLGAIPAEGYRQIDGDTQVSPGSGEAAFRAVGAVVAAVDALMAGEAANAFCAVRPPGHHAEPDRAMGFCLFNNVAIGALHARAHHGLARVAVIDFDVHHGNGTEAAFERDGSLFYASTHQMPLYPGTGNASDTGVGNIVNAPLPPRAGSDEFRHAMERNVLPALDAFRPEFIFISAGFDAHHADPLAMLELHDDDYEWATAEILAIADRHAGGRLVSTLEGGYDLGALATSAAAHVRALMAAG
jgi:acetoin utilization deacetylase AcuC-like enzyme